MATFSTLSIEPYADQMEVLSRAGLFITHGGISSNIEAIYNQTPIITMLGQNVERNRNGESSAAIGIGECLQFKDVEKLPELIEQMDQKRNKYMDNLSKARKELVTAGGVEKAVTEIETFLDKIGK